MKIYVLLILFFGSIVSSVAQRFPYEVDYLTFIENKGQWNKNILFSCQIPDGEMIFQKDFIGYILIDQNDQKEVNEYAHDHIFVKDTLKKEQKVSMFAFKVNFLGVNQTSHKHNLIISGNKVQESKRNYFKGPKDNWASNVLSYEEVLYENLYPKTDLKIFSKNGAIKYEFELGANANPEQIQLQYAGVDTLFVENEQLVIKTSLATIREDKPYAYTIHKGQQKEVSCSFQVKNNIVSFKLGEYNKHDVLVIDPQLIFSTYSGSLADNWGNTACLDQKGNLYTGGTVFYGVSGRNYTAQPNGFPATLGAFQETFQGGDTDIGILKFDSSGVNLAYATYIGGSGTEVPSSTITNQKGELFVLAITSSKDFPVSENAFKKTFTPTVPELEWFVNNKLVGTGYRFSADTLNLGDTIYARKVTNDFPCANNNSAFSNIIKVEPTPIPRVKIDSSFENFCPSTVTTIKANTTNAGQNPSFEWFVNNIAQGKNDSIFFSASLKENDTVFCVMQTSTSCGAVIDTSNFIVLKSLVGKSLSASISTKDMFLCTGGTYLIESVVKPHVSDLTYNWTIDNNFAGNDTVLTVSDLNEGSKIQLKVSSSFSCLSTSFASSNTLTVDNSIKMDISANLAVNRSTSTCSDYIISVNPLFGGSNPKIKWRYGYNAGTNSFFYTDNSDVLVWENFRIGNQDLFQVEVTSSLGCVNQKTVSFQDRIRNFYDRNQFDQFSIEANNFSACPGETFTVEQNSHEIDYSSVGGYIWQEGTDILVLKLSADGSQLLASTYLGGSRNDGVLETRSPLTNNYGDQLRGDIAVDENDFVYIASTTASKDFPIVNGFQPNYGGGNSDAILAKLTPNLDAIVWSTFIGGSSDESGMSVVRDTSGHVFTTGGTLSSDLKTTHTLDSVSRGDVDAFVVELSADGATLENSVIIGTPNFDQAYFIQKDYEENVYLLGQTKGLFPVIGNVYSNRKGGLFVQKLNPSLDSILFSTVLGDTLGDDIIVPNISPTAFLVNKCGNLFISGWGGDVNSRYNGGTTTHLPISSNAYQTTTDGSDFYMMVLHENADSLLYATYYGGALSHEHVDGGTSRFDDQGIVYQSVCAGCGGENDFPLFPTLDNDPQTYPKTNNSSNCNNGVFKFDLANLKAAFTAEPHCKDYWVSFENKTIGGVEFEWRFGDGKVKFTETAVPVSHKYDTSGVYTIKLIATDLTTCIGKDSAEITLELYPELKGQFYSDTICQGDSIQLKSREIENRFSYKWFPTTHVSNDTIPNPFVRPDSTQLYYLTITDDRGCFKTDTFKVNTTLLLDSINFKLIGSCQAHPQVQFKSKYGNVEGLTYTWDFGDGEISNESSPIHQFEKEGEYKVVLNTKNKYCLFRDETKVTLLPPYIPNVFTPNNDGKNETFYIKNIEGNGDWSLDVYNRWEKRVYYNTKYQNEWDGGNLSDATYFYLVISPDGKQCKGWVQIVR